MATMRTVMHERRLRRTARGQSGNAVGEVLVLTLPLCLLCIVAASKLAATSSARIKGQWKTSEQVQRDTTKPCGLDMKLTAPLYGVLLDSRMPKAWPILAVSLLPAGDFSSGLSAVSKKSSSLNTQVPKYFYQAHADRSLPDGINQIPTGATFACNEPGDPDDKARNTYATELEALSGVEAAKLFGIGPGVPGGSAPGGGSGGGGNDADENRGGSESGDGSGGDAPSTSDVPVPTSGALPSGTSLSTPTGRQAQGPMNGASGGQTVTGGSTATRTSGLSDNNSGTGSTLSAAFHQPGGPYHPPEGTKLSCSSQDDCSTLSLKINYLRHTIESHIQWDIDNPRPGYPDGRHAEEIADLQRALSNCTAIARAKCTNKAPKPVPAPAPAPASKPAPAPSGGGLFSWLPWAGGAVAGGGLVWWLGKLLSPACGPAAPLCAVVL